MIVALLGGAVAGVGFWGGPWAWVLWVAFVPLFHIVASRPREAFGAGWLFGLAYWSVGAYWTYAPAALLMQTTIPIAILASIPFLLFWSLPWGLAAAAAAWTRHPFLLVPAAAAIEIFWPQIYPSYLAVPLSAHLPTIQMLSIFGMGAAAWLVVGFNGALFSAAAYRRFKPLAAAVVLVLANEAYGRWTLARIAAEDAAAPRRLRVAVLQGSVPEERRWKPERYGENLAVYRGLLESVRERAPDLVVFPQNSYERVWRFGGGLDPWKVEFPRVMREEFPVSLPLLLGTRTTEIVGSRGDRSIVRHHHASVLVNADGSYGGLSEKRDPTPFSEWMPGSRYIPALVKLSPAMDRIHRGTIRPLSLDNGIVLGALICYDAVKPWNTRRLAAEASPDALVIQTSDSWADDDQMPRQNLKIAILRAVETRTPVIRAVTAGISARIDRAGRIVRRIEFEKTGAFVEDIPLVRERSWYVQTGNAVYFLSVALIVFLLIRRFFSTASQLDTRQGPC